MPGAVGGSVSAVVPRVPVAWVTGLPAGGQEVTAKCCRPSGPGRTLSWSTGLPSSSPSGQGWAKATSRSTAGAPPVVAAAARAAAVSQ